MQVAQPPPLKLPETGPVPANYVEMSFGRLPERFGQPGETCDDDSDEAVPMEID